MSRSSAPPPAGSKRHGREPHKQIVTIRLDADVLAWFKAQGPGYQTRVNQVLRDFMLGGDDADPLA
ncbi:MAG: BrnA antitoxin family protein [Pseudomonadota bacterium]